MKEIEYTYTWGGLKFHAPEGQEVFFATDWQNGQLGKGKQHDPNKDFECVWRIVDTGHRFTRNTKSSSKNTEENQISVSQEVRNTQSKSENNEVSDSGSQATMGSPEQTLTPTPTNNLLSLPSLERARSDKTRLTIACDTEFFYEQGTPPAPVLPPVVNTNSKKQDKNPKKVRHENGPRHIVSYQFALYLDDVHVLEVVFIVKPTVKKDGSPDYKRIALSQCLGTILDLCSLYQERVVDYRDTRRWAVTIRSTDGSTKDNLYHSPEEAMSAVGALQETYSDCVIDTSNVSADGADKQDVLMKRGAFIEEQVHQATEREMTCDLMTTKMWEWLLNEKFNKVKPNTYDRLEATLLYQILPAMQECNLTDIRLKDVTVFHLNQIMGSAFEKGYSYSTLLKMRDFLRCIFNYYEDDIKHNPMRKYTFYKKENVIAKQKSLENEKSLAEAKIAQQKAELAQEGASKIVITESEARLARLALKSQTSTNDIHVFSEDEITKIKEAIFNGYRKPFKSRSGNEVMSGLYIPKQGKFFLFMLNSGIRGGEAVALRYSDFDFDNCTVRIHGNAVNIKERNKDGSATGKRNRVISTPKTSTSDTLLDISPYAVSLIRELQTEEPEGYDGFILHSGHKPIAEKTLWQRFDKILRGAGVKPCGLHSLRHTYATMLYEATGGDIKLVSQQVRHSDPSFTTRTYVHQRSNRTKNIIQKIAF